MSALYVLLYGNIVLCIPGDSCDRVYFIDIVIGKLACVAIKIGQFGILEIPELSGNEDFLHLFVSLGEDKFYRGCVHAGKKKLGIERKTVYHENTSPHVQCANGGKTEMFSRSVYFCECPEGFKGERCQHDFSGCIVNQCPEGTFCTPSNYSYSCGDELPRPVPSHESAKCRIGHQGKLWCT